MMRRSDRPLELLLTLLFVVALPLAARATMELPGGDTLLNGAFDNLRYGSTGAASVTPLLYLGDLGTTDAPTEQDAVTDLAFQYALFGVGTSSASIEYLIQNIGLAPFSDLRFMLNVQADGSSSFSDFVNVVFGAGGSGEPDAFQVGDFTIDPLSGQLTTNDGANGSDACGALACDADLALQWNLATLDAGMIWRIRIALSDDGSSLSTRYLQATSADTADTVLTFSGVASVVPEPTTALLLGVGLAVLRVSGKRSRKS